MANKRPGGHGKPVRIMTPPPNVEEVDIEELADTPSPQDLEDQAKLADFQSQFGGMRYAVRVQRYNEETSELEIIDKVSLDTFDPYFIGKKCGGGRFVCTLYNDKSKYVEGGRFHFTFAKMKEPEKTTALQDPMILFVIEQMKSQVAQMTELLKTSLTGEKQAPIDQLVSALKGLHDMSPKDKAESPFKSLKELLELQAMIQPKGDESSDGKGIMSDVLEAFKVLNQGRNVPIPRQPLSSPTLNGPRVGNLPIVTRPSAAPENKEPEKPVDPLLKKIAPHIPLFIEAAAANGDPEKWAAYLVGTLETQIVPALVQKYGGMVSDDIIWERLIEAASSDEKIQKIYEFAPELRAYHEWVCKVIQTAVVDVSEEPQMIPLNGDSEN